VSDALEGAVYRYLAEATDPDGELLRFELVEGPEGMVVVAGSGLLTWIVPEDAAGVHGVRLVVVDERGAQAEQRFVVQVQEVNHAPRIESRPPPQARVGQRWEYPAQAWDPDGDALAWRLDEAPGGMVVDPAGVVRWTPDAAQAGVHGATLVVSDPGGAEDRQVLRVGVAGGPDDGAPRLELWAPADGARIDVSTDVLGSVQDGDLVAWELRLCPAAEREVDCLLLAAGDQPVQQALLGRCDPAEVASDLYHLRLLAWDAAGHEASRRVTVSVAGGAQLGQALLQILDLEVQVAGFTVGVARRWDGRAAGSGDFGPGSWSLQVSSVAIRQAEPLYDGWSLEQVPGGIPSWELVAEPLKIIAVRLGPEQLLHFLFVPELERARQDLGWARYQALDSGATLVALDEAGRPLPEELVHNSGQVFTFPDLLPYQPTGYAVQLEDGGRIEIDRRHGLTRYQDPARAIDLRVTPEGFTLGEERVIRIERDGGGRVVRIEGPSARGLNYRYDERSDLVEVEDWSQQRQLYRYDGRHQLVSYQLPQGTELSRMEYDEQGRLVRTVDGDGRVTEYTYDPEGRTQTVRDPLGRESVVRYDERGRIVQAEDPLGRVTAYAYSDDGLQECVTDPLERTTCRTHDEQGRLSVLELPGGERAGFSYDRRGLLVRAWGPEGQVLRVERTGEPGEERVRVYDETDTMLSEERYSGGHLVERRLPGERVTSYHWEGTHLARVEQADGSTVRFEPPAEGYRALVDADGRRTEFAYDPLGRLEELSLGGEVRFAYGYDGQDRATRVALPDGAELQLTYDGSQLVGMSRGGAEATLSTQLGADGRVAARRVGQRPALRFRYDAAGRQVATVLPDGREAQREYDAGDRLVALVDPTGRRTEVLYADTHDAPAGFVDAEGHTSSLTYDAAGRLATLTDPLGRALRLVRNERGQVLRLEGPGGVLSETEWDPSGRAVDHEGLPTRRWRPVLGELRWTWDSMGRLASTTDGVGARWDYEWSGTGLLQAIVDPAGQLWERRYDGLGRLAELRTPTGTGRRFGYDDSGHLAWEAWDAAEGERRLLHAYDGQGRPTRLELPDGEALQRGYTSSGRLAWAEDAAARVELSYDDLDRPRSVRWDDGAEVAYTWAGQGQVASVRVRAGAEGPWQELTFSRSPAGRLAAIERGGQELARFDRDPAGRLTAASLGNGARITLDYGEGSDRLAEISHTAADGALLAHRSYVYDEQGRRVRAHDNAGSTWRWTYDASGRLVQEQRLGPGPTWTIDYGYDARGDRVLRRHSEQGEQVAEHDRAGRLVALEGPDGRTELRWDGRDRLVERSGPGGTWRFTWDDRDRLVLVEQDGLSVQYVYDPLGMLLERHGAEGRRRFVHDLRGPDGLPVIAAEAGPDGSVVRTVHGPLGPLARIDEAGRALYYHAGASGSVLALSDGHGGLVGRPEATAFGEPRAFDGADPEDPWRFAGEWQDRELGLVYLRARWYDPTLGRFLSPDPAEPDLQDPATANRYAYARSNPIQLRDPSGRLTMVEMSMVQAIQGVLRNWRTLAAQFIKCRAKRAIVSALAQVGWNLLLSGAGPLLADAMDAAASAVLPGDKPWWWKAIWQGMKFEDNVGQLFCRLWTSWSMDFDVFAFQVPISKGGRGDPPSGTRMTGEQLCGDRRRGVGPPSRAARWLDVMILNTLPLEIKRSVAFADHHDRCCHATRSQFGVFCQFARREGLALMFYAVMVRPDGDKALGQVRKAVSAGWSNSSVVTIFITRKANGRGISLLVPKLWSDWSCALNPL